MLLQGMLVVIDYAGTLALVSASTLRCSTLCNLGLCSYSSSDVLLGSALLPRDAPHCQNRFRYAHRVPISF